ncbi:MAG TPA: Hpt domain-containing protein [Caulobacteraceae bacterium]
MSDTKSFGGRFKLGGLDAGAVARAEAALKSLSSNFDAWMAEELDKLEAARGRLRAEGMTPEVGEALYFRAHDLKGLGATYGYPLVTRLAGSLCRVLHDPAERLNAPAYLIEAHVDAIHAVVRKNLRDEADATGRALSEELETQVTRLRQAAA